MEICQRIYPQSGNMAAYVYPFWAQKYAMKMYKTNKLDNTPQYSHFLAAFELKILTGF